MPENSTNAHARNGLSVITNLALAAIVYDFTHMSGYAVALVSAFLRAGLAATSSVESYPVGRVIETASLTTAGTAMIGGFVAHFAGRREVNPHDPSFIGSNSPANIGLAVLFIATLLTALGQNISDRILGERPVARGIPPSLIRPSRGERVSASLASMFAALALAGYTLVLAFHDDHSNVLNEIAGVSTVVGLVGLAVTATSRMGYQQQRMRAVPARVIPGDGGIQGEGTGGVLAWSDDDGERRPLTASRPIATRTAAAERNFGSYDSVGTPTESSLGISFGGSP